MALDDFDLAQLLKRMGIFGDAPAAPAWMTRPHQTISAPGEATSGIPQTGDVPWYAATTPQPRGPAAGLQAEPQNDELAGLFAEPWNEGGIQGPAMGDIQIQQAPAEDDPETRKRKAALASIGGM